MNHADVGCHVDYTALNSKQQEIYNFQKLAGLLADYGYNCIKLADDWKGADFLADPFDKGETLKVQQKGCLTIDQNYAGQDIHMAFPVNGEWHLIPHHELVRLVGEHTNALNTGSWLTKGNWFNYTPNAALKRAIRRYRLVPAPPKAAPTKTTKATGDVVVRVGRELNGPLNQTQAALALVSAAVEIGGASIADVQAAVGAALKSVDGFVNGEELWRVFSAEQDVHNPKQWFVEDPIFADGRTWLLKTNVWTGAKLHSTGNKLSALTDGTVGLVEDEPAT